MYIEFIQDYKGENDKHIPAGTKHHMLNEAAKELIAQGIARSLEDPTNYAPYPIESEKTSLENSTDENESDNKPNKLQNKRVKKAKKRQ